jgi:hypothetical protein
LESINLHKVAHATVISQFTTNKLGADEQLKEMQELKDALE